MDNVRAFAQQVTSVKLAEPSAKHRPYHRMKIVASEIFAIADSANKVAMNIEAHPDVLDFLLTVARSAGAIVNHLENRSVKRRDVAQNIYTLSTIMRPKLWQLMDRGPMELRGHLSKLLVAFDDLNRVADDKRN